MVNSLSASVGEARNMDSIPGLGRSLEEEMALVYLPGELHGQRSLVGYIQSKGLQRVGHD